MSKRKNRTTRQPPQKARDADKAPSIGSAALKAQDSYSNPMTRLGYGQPNTSEGAEYPITRLTQNFGLMNSLYRNNWICRRIIDIVPEDMMKNGYKITSQLTPEAMARIERLERKTQLRKRILTGLKWGRLYGGTVGIIAISGQEDMLDQPLDYDAIVPGSFKGIIVMDRWTGVMPSLELVGDITDPDFGLPTYYNTYAAQSRSTGRVHHSRVVRFIGRELPFLEEQMEMYWGASEMEHIYEELKKFDNTSYNIAQLVFMANLRVMKMDGMEGVTSVMNDKAMEAIRNTVSAQNKLMNNNSIQILGAKDDFQTHQYAFSGLPDVFEKFMLSVSGAAEIPVTKLFGQAPAGLNATGESDLQNYYDSIEEKQEAYLRPIYDRLLPIMCMSEFGAIPSDLDYEFKPIRRLSDTERVELTGKHTSAIIEAYNAGLISQKMALKELQQMKETTGAWSNITDQDVARADDNFDLGGEMGAMMPDFSQPQKVADADWKEEEHPRAKNGQFGSGGSSTKEETKQLTQGERSVNLKSSSKGKNVFKRGFPQQNLTNHWAGGASDHSDEYPDMTKEEYAQRALELIQQPVGGHIEGYKNKDGQIVRYDKKSNDYVKGHPDRGVATMFKPKEELIITTIKRKKKGLKTMIKCPVCGQYEFKEHGDFDGCPCCHWQNDNLQNDEPDYWGGANDMSLNEYKEAWENGGDPH